MASPSSVGRRRGLPKQMSSEDQALNQIAKEAEARLAAKRAARAEARSIRMKDLERKQREADDQVDEVDHVDRSQDEDEEVLTKKKQAPSRITATSSPVYNAEPPAPPAVADPQLKESLREAEERYRKSMVNNAQLDNEKQALQYQVECLKDIIEDLEENLDNVKDELLDRTKEHNKLSREHVKTEEELTKCTKLLHDRERILDEHCINLDGTLRVDDEADSETQSRNTNISTGSNPDLEKEYEAERQSLLSEIDSLKAELTDLKTHSDTDLPRRGVDQFKPDGVDFERSFVDVSTEAANIGDSGMHTGMYVNNNEKCDEFEVIDDGSTQGGIRHFEDKSFEQSGRSSLLSFVQTDGVEESVESEIPLEISVDLVKHSRDEYDIVHMGDDSTIQKEENPATHINVNQYVMSDDDYGGSSDGLSAETFSVDRYFASDDVSSVKEVEAANSETEVTNPENVDADENDASEMSMNYENIEVQDIPVIKPEVADDESVRNSPYLEVDAESIEKNNSFVEASIDIALLESPEQSVSKDVNDTQSDEAYIADEFNVNDESRITDDPEVVAISHLESSPVEEISYPDPNTADSNKDENSSTDEHSNETDNVDGAALSMPSSEVTSLLNTIDDKPTIIKAGVFTEQKPLLVRPQSVVTDENVSQDVVDFYDQIVGGSSNDISPVQSNDNLPQESRDSLSQQSSPNLPQDATFGVFGITGRVESTETTTVDVQEDPTPQDGSQDTTADDKTPKPQGWLVRVESFNAPEIKVVNPERPDSPETPATDTPVPKERKKKKKKKKDSKTEKAPPPIEATDPDALTGAPTPSVPELLGYEPSAESSKQRSSNTDIPQQFLDVSNTLASESLSDLSDIEVEEDGTKKKREGSKKGNKKENCKTQ